MAETPASAATAAANPDKKSSAGSTPDPWEACAAIRYGSDRSLAWSVRQQVVATPPEGRARVEERLLKALALPACTDAGRAFVCEMLALAGSAKAVPALVALLPDPKNADAVRYALEAIPGSEAEAALLAALAVLPERPKIGVIGSLAMRRVTQAKDALAALQGSATETPAVREAAARALAHLNSSATS